MKIINKYIPAIERIEFAVTHSCTSNCKHCSIGKVCSSDHVDTDVAIRVIKDITKHFNVDSLMTFGGEPLLYSDTVCEIHKTATECGILKRQIITNGCFSKDQIKTIAVSKMLKESGVNNILLSVDTFHSEFLSLEHQYVFAKALCDMDFECFELHPAWVVNREHPNKYNAATEKCLNFFSDLKIPVSEGNNIFPAGNANIYLSEFYQKYPIDTSFRCGQAPYTTRLDEVQGISINPNGDVIICAFPIGNIYKNSIIDIISSYDPYKNPIMSALINQGIVGICELAKQQGITVELTDYYSPCNLCYDIARKLS
ncbi:MAG: hypothetical protein K0R09_1461 [Clostridiales bacterium]|jgi:MoaA/NifB/PqqE/SkfB family radical SAM enzyme|nr:hypothetical protein [Clostridiales bacterium]